MKKNNIIKALGVGTLAFVGAFTFAGCSLNAEDKALVENKVAELQQQLEEQNNLLEQQNNLINQQLLVDKAWGLIQTAQAKLLINIDGARDNLVIEQTVGDQTRRQEFYKTEAGDYVFVEDDNVRYKEADQSGVYRYSMSMENGDRDKKNKLKYTNMEAYFAEEKTFDLTSSFLKENITNVEIMGNGDYKVTFVYNRDDELEYSSQLVSSVLEIVVTSDAKFISVTNSIVQVQKWEGNEHSDEECHAFVYLNMKAELKYGEVNIEDILTKLEEAKLYNAE